MYVLYSVFLCGSGQFTVVLLKRVSDNFFNVSKTFDLAASVLKFYEVN